LPIPGSNAIFLGPILAYAFALLEDDGVLAMIGHVATALLILAGVALAAALASGASALFA
jgi:hypothetical protein